MNMLKDAPQPQPPLTSAAATAAADASASAQALAERVRAAETLLASELRYRRLFESARDGILILDAESGMVVDVNPFLIEKLGFTREAFLGKKLWELGFFKDIVANEESFAELQHNEYIRYEDKPLETADGRRIDVEFVSNVYLVNHQKVIQCNIRDITDRKARERLLREQNEILSNSHEGVMIVNLANQVLLWNRGAAETFGWSAADAIGQLPERLLGVEDRSTWTVLRAAVERDGFWNGELRASARDGRRLVIDCRTTLVRDEAGRPRAQLSFLADVTEKKMIEAKFLRVQRLEAIGTLSGGIAHDLNNILAPVLMAAGLLRDRVKVPRDREMVALIENAARRGADVIRQLLTFSRGIEGQRVIVQVRHPIKEIAGIVRETFPRNISFCDRVEPELWPIVADATQLHQVLLNLCVNARDAMPDGGVLTISAQNVRLAAGDLRLGAAGGAGAFVLVTVQDTGQGIAREIVDRIFEPFFTTKGIGQGTGLGLSTVLGIVRSHGGFVTVESEPNQGSKFLVYLPALPEGGASAGPVVIDEPEAGRGETILVVDDESAILTAARQCLETHGYHVLTAADGKEGLALFTAHAREVRLVLTDVMMPVMDGLKLARGIRALDPKVPVIAASGLDPAAQTATLTTGLIAEYLTKPYDRLQLLTAVRRRLKTDVAAE